MSATHRLAFPVTQRFRDSSGEREELVEEITLRRMKGKDMRLADRAGGDVARSLELIVALSGLPMKVIEELDAVDVEALGGIVAGFTETGPQTGESS